jgi:glycosyltransferase involved in cell wall biosynthesis
LKIRENCDCGGRLIRLKNDLNTANRIRVGLVGTDVIDLRFSLNASIPIIHYNLANQLNHIYVMHVYSPLGRNQEKTEYCDGVKFHHIQSNLDNWSNYFALALLHRFPSYSQISAKCPFFSSGINGFTYSLQVAKSAKAEKCHIIQIAEESQFVPTIRAINPSAKIVLSMHCEWLTQLDPKMISKRLEKTSLITGCSDYITNKIRFAFPMLAERCRTVYNGVDTAKFSRLNWSANSKKLLFVSRSTPEKGLHILFQALSRVVKKYPDVHLDVVGPQEMWPIDVIIRLSDDPKVKKLGVFHAQGRRDYYNDYLNHQLNSLGISRNVSFHGLISHNKVVEYYQNADLFILPSFSESFGMGLIEAMACELPVVATKVGGIPEVVEDGTTGLTVESGDSKGLAEAILYILSNDGLRKSMGRRARERVMRLFSWERIAKDTSSLYEEVCEGS